MIAPSAKAASCRDSMWKLSQFGGEYRCRNALQILLSSKERCGGGFLSYGACHQYVSLPESWPGQGEFGGLG